MYAALPSFKLRSLDVKDTPGQVHGLLEDPVLQQQVHGLADLRGVDGATEQRQVDLVLEGRIEVGELQIHLTHPRLVRWVVGERRPLAKDRKSTRLNSSH